MYGILCRGHHVNTGDRVSIESPLTLIIGNGQYGEDEDIDYTEPEAVDGDYTRCEDDEFEEVTEPVMVEE